jgi:hypothetical protein
LINKITNYEKAEGIQLPEIFKDFYIKYKTNLPEQFTGSDLFNDTIELSECANKLLKEDGVESFLSPDDFVFMVHQGYMFWYFKADGNNNPKVYFYQEGALVSKEICTLRYFINNYPKI